MAVSNPDMPLDESKRRHRREVLTYILLPMLGGVLLIGVIMALVIALPRVLQVSIVADFTMTVLMLCPLVLCTLPFSIGLGIVAVMSGRLHPAAAKPLRKGEALSLRMRQRVDDLSERVAQASIQFNARLAPLMQWLDHAFDRPEAGHNDEVKDDSNAGT